MYCEKDLDPIIEKAFNDSEDFVKWFLSKTKYTDTDARCVWSRSDSPWSKITFKHVDPETGVESDITRDSETDILVVLEADDGVRFAFHIENKLAGGSYTQYQPEMYRSRANAWINNDKYGRYTEFETVLLAPLAFYKNNLETSKPFDRYVSYEEASIFIPELVGACRWPI